MSLTYILFLMLYMQQDITQLPPLSCGVTTHAAQHINS
jgi:hypothetical protein